MAASPVPNRDLSAMHDIVLPPAPELWPPAPGWIVFGSLLLMLTTAASVVLWRRWRAVAYRREALRDLACSIAALESGDVRRAAVESAAVLRRVAIHVWTRELVAPLTGRTWIEFLSTHGGRAGFSDRNGATLLSACYGGGEPSLDDARALLEAITRWVRAQGVPRR